MTQNSQFSGPIQSFILSSWSHTIGPQVLVMWRLKKNQMHKLSKSSSSISMEAYVQSESKIGTGTSYQQQDISRSLDTSSIQEDLCFIPHYKHFDDIYHINSNTKFNLEELIFMDDHNDNCSSSEDAVIKAAGKLLLGELENDHSTSGCYSRLFLLPDKNTVLATNLFTTTTLSVNGRLRDIHHLSLSCVFNCENRDFLFGIYAIIDLMLRREMALIQQLKVITVGDIKSITPHLSNICDVAFDLYNNVAKYKQSVPCANAFRTLYAENAKFLERALASHFQSCSCSTVIGESENDINGMIHLLQLFQDHKERFCLNYYSPNNRSCSYQPGLCIQGLLKNSYGKSDLLFHDLKHHPCPMTVIDLCRRKVRTTLHSRLICQQEEDDSLVEPDLLKVESSLQTVTESGKLIPNMLCESQILCTRDGCTVAQEIHAKHFSRYLSLTASSLVKITERYREMNLTTSPKLLKMVLGQSEAADLKAIIGSAEKLKVGICSVYNEK